MEALTQSILNFAEQIKIPAIAILILDIVVAGILCMIPSSKYKQIATGFLVGGIIGLVLILGAVTFGNEIKDTIVF